MKLTKKYTRKGFTLVELLVVIAIIVTLAGVATPVILSKIKQADKVKAISNAKQIFLLLQGFDQDFNSFPNQATAQEDADLTGLTGSSNKLLSQLIVSGGTNSEEIFFVKGGAPKGGKTKPDNIISPSGKILEAGECGFGYIKDQDLTSNLGRPILVAPIDSTGDGKTFNGDIFDGKAVALRIDGSVQTYNLTRDSTNKKAKISGGKTLFESGTGTVWENASIVDVAKPE